MPEGSDVGVGQLGEERDDDAHQVAVEYDAVLTLSHQHRHKVAELGVEPAAVRARLRQRILGAILKWGEGNSESKTQGNNAGERGSRRLRHLLTASTGHVTVRIHGKARNFLYCRPET